MRVVFVKAENTRYNDIEVAFDKAGYIENLSIFKQRCDASRNRVNAFLRKAGSVVWWGAGSASVILLNGVEKRFWMAQISWSLMAIRINPVALCLE